MKKTDKNLYLLMMILSAVIVTANVLASKVVSLNILLNGSPISVPAAVIAYPITFLITDIIGELWGKKEAQTAVNWGFIAQLFSTVLIAIARILPTTDEAQQIAFDMVLGQAWVFAIASLISYAVSQTWDVQVFHAIRDSYIAKHGSTKGGKWLWNNGSTMTSQILDTVIFIGIAFGIGMGWLFDPSMRPALWNMMLGQYFVKLAFAICDTPFFYFFTRERKVRAAK